MFVLEDIGKRLPFAVYYDLDNTALEHGAQSPSPEIVNALGDLSRCGVETIAVTGRDIDDARHALIELPGRLAIIAGGAITTFIKHDSEANGAEIIPTASLGLGFGYELLDDIGAEMVAERISEWLDSQAVEHDATVHIPASRRKMQFLEDAARFSDEEAIVRHRFTVPDAVFVSGLSSPESANTLALLINSSGLDIADRALFAVPVNSQTGKPEVQITTRQANKKLAIEKLARLGLPIFNDRISSDVDTLSDSIYVGDGLNDLPAFEAVGFSVAMADAPQEVLSAASHVIGSQSDGGFVKFIETLTMACSQ